MNNLHRELAPISEAAWAQIEQETTRTLKRTFRVLTSEASVALSASQKPHG